LKTGSLIIEIYGELLEKESIDTFKNTVHQSLVTVAAELSFDYRRFSYFATSIIYVIELKLFWKNDIIYNTLKRSLNQNFVNWTLDITLLLQGCQVQP